jgi:CHAT domain-containing protein/tetratricopeptide (TPR) repeat protein
MTYFGVAMGERDDTDDPASKTLSAALAEILCLKGDVEGCLAASKEGGRSLGSYVGPLPKAQDPSSFAVARAFLLELHPLSQGWGKDQSLASECLGYLEQIAGDHLRDKARVAAAAEFKKALRTKSMKSLITAGRLAWWMLDQEKITRTADLLAAAVKKARDSGEDLTRHKEDLREVLSRGRDTYLILGKKKDAGRIDKLLSALETKALTPPDLAFELGPSAKKFKTDLIRAQKELKRLADRAPLRSRASVLLHFMAAYAGVIAEQPGAALALRSIRETLSVADPYLSARAVGLLGRGALLSGDYFRAAGLLRQAAAKMSKAKRLKGLMLANAGQALFYLGQHQQAAKTFTNAIALMDDDPRMKIQALLGLGHAYSFAGKTTEAGAALDRAEKSLGKVDDPGLSRMAQIDRALWLVMSDRKDEALKLFEQVAKDKDKKIAAIARTNLAELYNDMGKHKQALAEARSALKGLNEERQADAAWQARCERARALAGLGKKKPALKDYLRAMELVERLRAKIGAEGSRRSFSAAKIRLYAGAVSLLVSMGKAEQAFLVSERARSRAFLDMLGERTLKLSRKKDQKKLGPARSGMLKSLPPLPVTFGPPAAALEGKKSRKAIKLPKPDPKQGWISLVTVNPAGVRDVQRVLKKDEALVSFFHDGQRLLCFLVTPKKVLVKSAEMSKRDLLNYSQSFLRMVQNPRRYERKVKAKGKRLFDRTFGPVVSKLKAKRLVVVPWGPLHYVPFMALWDGQRYLVDRFEGLTTVPSASVLVMTRAGGRNKKGEVFALGNPQTDMPDLPSALEEVKILGKLFGRARVETGAKATRSVFKQTAPSARMIHVASHGVFFPERPMDSYLALSGKTPEAGRLPAQEILQMNLSRASLVVLSACNSGRGEVENGEEIIGLTRAFLHAGTTSLVASLWLLSDESAQKITNRFYQEIKMGTSPSAAMIRAAREVKKQKDYSHPFFWAPLTVIGG